MRVHTIIIQTDGSPIGRRRSDTYGLRDALRRDFENLELILLLVESPAQRALRKPGTEFACRNQLPRILNEIYRQWFHRGQRRLLFEHLEDIQVLDGNLFFNLLRSTPAFG